MLRSFSVEIISIEIERNIKSFLFFKTKGKKVEIHFENLLIEKLSKIINDIPIIEKKKISKPLESKN